MLLNKKQLFFRDLFRSRKMLSWLKKICWILFFLLCMIKLYAQSEVIPGLFTTYQQNGRILWVIPDSLLGRDMSLTTTILEGAGRKKKSADAKFGYQGDRSEDFTVGGREGTDNIEGDKKLCGYFRVIFTRKFIV